MNEYNEYQKIVKTYYNYNPIQDGFTSEEEYHELFQAWELGAPEQSKIFYKKIAYFAFDYVAHLFEGGYMEGDFCDALQNSYMFVQSFNQPLPSTLKGFRQKMAKHIDTCFEKLESEEKTKNVYLNFDKRASIYEIPDESTMSK